MTPADARRDVSRIAREVIPPADSRHMSTSHRSNDIPSTSYFPQSSLPQMHPRSHPNMSTNHMSTSHQSFPTSSMPHGHGPSLVQQHFNTPGTHTSHTAFPSSNNTHAKPKVVKRNGFGSNGTAKSIRSLLSKLLFVPIA